MNQDDEGRGAAVENRNLGAVHLDEGIVHTQPVERRQEMLHRVHADPVASEGRRVVLFAQAVEPRRDQDSDVRPPEADPVLGRSGEKA